MSNYEFSEWLLLLVMWAALLLMYSLALLAIMDVI
jgi:hypothetical protein